MAKNNENMDFANEFPEGAENMEMNNIPEGAEAAEGAAHQTYTLNDGTQGSRAAFIREKFLVDNMSRKEIADEFGFAYRVVYSATVNMTNSAEAPARGRSAVNATIQVTESGAVVTVEDGVTKLNGEPVEEGVELGELKEVNRNEWIKSQVEAGVSRGDIAKILGLSYGVIYGLTKEQEGTRARIEIELEDGTKVSRAEYIRMQFAAGVSRGDIAKELNVPYSVVWQATKTEKTDADHFAELVESIKSFADKVTDADLFSQICNALDTVVIKVEDKDAADADAEATDAE